MELPEIKKVCVEEKSTEPVKSFSVSPVGGKLIAIEKADRLSREELIKIKKRAERMREILNGGVNSLDASIAMLTQKISTQTCN